MLSYQNKVLPHTEICKYTQDAAKSSGLGKSFSQHHFQSKIILSQNIVYIGRTIVFYHFVFDFTTSLEIYFDPSFEATTLEDSWMNASVVLLQEACLSFKMLHLVLAQYEF